MTSQQAIIQPRVGVRFVEVSPADQANLDGHVFALMGKKNRARRPVNTPSSGSSKRERRIAPRVDMGPADDIELTLLPTRPRGALAEKSTELSCDLHDISTTGCSFLCPDPTGIQLKALIRIRLKGDDLDLELKARVIHINEP